MMLNFHEMNVDKKYVCLISLILLSLPSKGFSQNIHRDDSVNIKLKDAAREIMAEAELCALVTLDDSNSPMVRVMSPFLPEDDFTVWLGTNPKSRKVNQIKKNPNVTLYYLAQDASGYVVIRGKAQLVDDQEEKDNRWKEEWKAFYANKTDSYLLIKVKPRQMEIVSYKHGILGDEESWTPPVVNFDY
jgi:general stress protein 26